MKPIIKISVLVFFIIVGCQQNDKKEAKYKAAQVSKLDWTYSDSLRKIIQLPDIPDKTIIVFNNPRGISGSEKIATTSIQKAIDKAAENGGGTVVIPKGEYLSVPLQLKSNVHLFLEDGAVLKFIPDPKQYSLVYTWFDGIPCMNYSPMIYAKDQVNIKISGTGTIDGLGNSPEWKDMKYREEVDWTLLKDLEDENVKPEYRIFGVGHNLRPELIAFVNCKKVEVSGLIIQNAPYWAIHPILCEDVSLINLRIESRGFDQLGIVPESSNRILIDNVNIQGVYDGIRIKSGRVKDPELRASEDILIQNSTIKNVVGDAIAVGSVVRGGAARIFISGIKINDAKRGFSITTAADLKGAVNDIFVKDIQACSIFDEFIHCEIYDSPESNKPLLHNLYFDRLTIDSCGRAFFIKGDENQPVQNVSIENSTFNSFKGSVAENVKSLNLTNITDNNTRYNQKVDIEDIKSDKIEGDRKENDILDTDDIHFDQLHESVKTTINKLYPLIPINNINRIITKTKVYYEIELELEYFQKVALLISTEGTIIRSEQDIPFKALPPQVIATLRSFIKTEPHPYLMDEIKKIKVQDFIYYELKGETREILFLAGIAENGTILEEKQKHVTSSLQSVVLKKTQK